MLETPITVTVDYPDSYYSDLPEDIRLAYKHMGKLLLMESMTIMNNPEVRKSSLEGDLMTVDKIVDKHVEVFLDSIEDLVSDISDNRLLAIDRGVVLEYEIYNIIKNDVTLREDFEYEGSCYLRVFIHLLLNDPSAVNNITNDSWVLVQQVYDYLKVSFT